MVDEIAANQYHEYCPVISWPLDPNHDIRGEEDVLETGVFTIWVDYTVLSPNNVFDIFGESDGFYSFTDGTEQ